MDRIISWLLDFLITLPVILISLSVHELMHGYAAYRLGDPTAKFTGRLSLNPLRHIDPIGFLALVLFHFGWAKPVPINSRYFKNVKRDIAITSLAGPCSNFILAFLSAFLYAFLLKIGISSNLLLGSEMTPFGVLTMMAQYMVVINLGLGVFNLIPLPPLDGSKVLYAFLPYRIIYKIQPYERYIQLFLLVFLWFGALSAPIQRATSFLMTQFMNLALGVFF